MAFVQSSVVNRYLNSQDKDIVKQAYENFTEYFHKPDIQKKHQKFKRRAVPRGGFKETLGSGLELRILYNCIRNSRPDPLFFSQGGVGRAGEKLALTRFISLFLMLNCFDNSRWVVFYHLQ